MNNNVLYFSYGCYKSLDLRQLPLLEGVGEYDNCDINEKR